ncbi:hypothetical protein TNCV_3869381 [Trichonephila clavipes]|nr:hypothetical protein TNCV_3869381 [Trichonephila clavipes]
MVITKFYLALKEGGWKGVKHVATRSPAESSSRPGSKFFGCVSGSQRWGKTTHSFRKIPFPVNRANVKTAIVTLGTGDLPSVPLTPAHPRRRSLWCREHRNWRDNEWGRVLLTDNNRFSLSSDSHRILIWR